MVNPCDTLVSKNHDLCLKNFPKTPAKEARMVVVPYVSATKSLMYVMMCTQPDLTFK